MSRVRISSPAFEPFRCDSQRLGVTPASASVQPSSAKRVNLDPLEVRTMRTPTCRRRRDGRASVRIHGRDVSLGRIDSSESHDLYQSLVSLPELGKQLLGSLTLPDQTPHGRIHSAHGAREFVTKIGWARSANPRQVRARPRETPRLLNICVDFTVAADALELVSRHDRQLPENPSHENPLRCVRPACISMSSVSG